MQSKGLFGKKYLQIETHTRQIGAPDEDHVIIKIHTCGVCGTDVNFVRDWSDDFMPLGHEVAAEVLEVGKNVTTVTPGDRVIVEDVSMCGLCEACKRGEPQFCRNMYDMEGQPGLGEYMSVRFNCLNKFEGLDYTEACLTEPLAVALTAVLNAEIPLGGSVVVLGPGPLGLMAARLARLCGAGFVGLVGRTTATECGKARLELATRWGCDLVVASDKQSIEDEIKTTYPNGVDRVIVSSPPETIYDALKIIRFGGIISFFGLHFGGKNTITVDVNDLIFRKITLRPTFAEPAINFPAALQLIKSGQIDAKALVTHCFGFAQAKAVLQAIIDGSQPIIKAVMRPHDEN
jgi:L-iditol 2-dehydrogenase